ncbi:MAG: nucleoside hydrolase [Clostridia bacterium]|nr:nucleoside hydrolase [Clostridia bacterium]
MDRELILKNLERPCKKIDVILDTDAYNEIDDQFAISYMLTYRDRLNILGITAAPFLNEKASSPGDGMDKSYDEILKLLDLARAEDLKDKVYKGSREYIKNEVTPYVSSASQFMVKAASEHTAEDPLYIAAIGAITNVASAFMTDPSMAERCVVVWLGGNEIGYPREASEFNMEQDIIGARIIFSSGVPLVQLPCMGVVDHFATSRWELEHFLSGRGPLCDYLASNTIKEAESYAAGKPWTRVIWDVTAIAWLVDRDKRFLRDKIIPRYTPNHDKKYENSDANHPFAYVYQVNRDALFEDLFGRLTSYENL